MIFFKKEIKDKLFSEIANCKRDIAMISAFCKVNVLEEIDSILDSSVTDKKLLVRFRTEDVAKGVTDYSLIEYCFQNNWKLYVNFNLHAKIYIIDNIRCIIGSANMTGKGLSLNPINNNIEISAMISLEDEDKDKIESLFDSSILIDEDTKKELDVYYSQLEKIPSGGVNISWDDFLRTKQNPKDFVLFTQDFPSTKSPTTDIDKLEFLELNDYCSEDEVKEIFKSCKAVKWLESVIKEKEGKFIFFGELTQKLHNSLLNDPTPYRKDVKILLANLLGWIEHYKIDQFKIDVPRHSQRISLV